MLFWAFWLLLIVFCFASAYWLYRRDRHIGSPPRNHPLKRRSDLLHQMEIERAAGNYEAAIQIAANLIELDPDNLNAYWFRHRVYTDAGQYELALNDLNHLIQKTDDARYYALRGLLYFRWERYEEALQDFERGMTSGAIGEDLSYVCRSLLAQRQGKLEQALADMDTAIRLNSTDAAHYTRREALHCQLGNEEAAHADHWLAQRHNTIFPLNIAYDVAKHVVEGRRDEAKALWRKVTDIDPSYQDTDKLVTEFQAVTPEYGLLGLRKMLETLNEEDTALTAE
jgi:tetratricopeptide (TPR) repeat protein